MNPNRLPVAKKWFIRDAAADILDRPLAVVITHTHMDHSQNT
ncbi:MAG: hypothetical protein ABGX04_12660 [Myxococcales bacterium]